MRLEAGASLNDLAPEQRTLVEVLLLEVKPALAQDTLDAMHTIEAERRARGWSYRAAIEHHNELDSLRGDEMIRALFDVRDRLQDVSIISPVEIVDLDADGDIAGNREAIVLGGWDCALVLAAGAIVVGAAATAVAALVGHSDAECAQKQEAAIAGCQSAEASCSSVPGCSHPPMATNSKTGCDYECTVKCNCPPGVDNPLTPQNEGGTGTQRSTGTSHWCAHGVCGGGVAMPTAH